MQSLPNQDRDLFLSHEIIQLGYNLGDVEMVKKSKVFDVYLDLMQKARKETYELINNIRMMEKNG